MGHGVPSFEATGQEAPSMNTGGERHESDPHPAVEFAVELIGEELGDRMAALEAAEADGVVPWRTIVEDPDRHRYLVVDVYPEPGRVV